MPFGASVTQHDGVDGLPHRTEWATEPRLGRPVTVRILALDLANR